MSAYAGLTAVAEAIMFLGKCIRDRPDPNSSINRLVGALERHTLIRFGKQEDEPKPERPAPLACRCDKYYL